jgi:AcrR family transcriptional regulator
MSSKEIAERAALGRAPARANGRRPGRPTLSNEELLDKALDLFLKQGFEGTSIDAITAAAGVAKRTVYLRYGDKKSLFKASLQRAIEEWIVPIERLRAAESDDLEETLQKIGRILVTNLMRPAGLRLLRITNAESVRMPEIGVYTYEQGTGRTLAYLADLFRRRIGPSTVSMEQWNEAAMAFMFLVVSGPPTITLWGMTVDDATIRTHTSYCVRLFLHGLLPHREGAPGPSDNESTESRDLGVLQEENRRLRKLLVASMLEAASYKERIENR